MTEPNKRAEGPSSASPGSGTESAQQRAERVRQGDVRTAARLMRDVDDRVDGVVDVLKILFAHTGHAYVVGITGNPGSGKSTVVDALIATYRAEGRRVGVVAVDPTSPFSGGAILGDRIRMQRHATDEGVFIRSLATRGNLGGLSRSTADVVTVLDAMGFDIILVETVGVGQDEIEVVSLCHTTVVLTVPGLGDDIQAMKAGILEIADILVVNKADRDGADRTLRDLTYMLQLRSGRAQGAPARGPALPGRDASVTTNVELVKTIATQDEGVAELVAAIARHRDRCAGAAGLARARVRAAAQLTELVKDRLADRAERALAASGGIEDLAAEVVDKTIDPYTASERVLALALGKL